ncbi:10189_t:CDS:2 [Funneliformis geosporum]|uniref:17635_t:CDS:1 n=1 Tax=Funneliformis geosporum TaxID=1117311 RepID=A0A9W4SR69_9GLOM|nr:10189_t:CDS:2 [Funneliformis geosporum]CAI2178444.1 17635_t:CDS:2 [Funneliformis geosporum]
MNANEEREVVAKAVLRSECDNHFYEYLIQRREQTSFVKEIQIENSCYCTTLLNLKNDHELGVNAKSALDAFELTQYSNKIESTNLPTNFHHQREVQQELPESDAEFNTMRTEIQDYHEDNSIDIVTNVTDDYLQEAVESMVGKVRSGILKVDNVNLEEIFEKYRDESESRFE